MNRTKHFSYLFLPLAAILFIKLCFLWTDGFKIQKITPGFTIKPSWNPPAITDPAKREELSHILNQEYRYLARGQQAYVFESADQKYVIKFLRMPKFRLPFWAYLSLFPASLEERKMQKISAKKSYLDLTSKSFAMAQEELWEESGLIFCHLQTTNDLHYSVKIVDRIGRENILDLDRLFFIVQKRAEPLGMVLKELRQKNDHREIEKLLSSFVDVIHKRSSKKIRNKNRRCMKNLGVLEGKVIEFDLGEFRERQLLSDPVYFQMEMQKSSRGLREFLQKEMPEYTSYLDDSIQNSLKKVAQ